MSPKFPFDFQFIATMVPDSERKALLSYGDWLKTFEQFKEKFTAGGFIAHAVPIDPLEIQAWHNNQGLKFSWRNFATYATGKMGLDIAKGQDSN